MGIRSWLTGSGQPRSRQPVAAATQHRLGEDLWRFGLYKIRPTAAPPELAGQVSHIEPAYYPECCEDQEAFTERVLQAARARGGWALYGGAQLVRSLATKPFGVTYDQLMDECMQFLRSRSINYLHLAPVEIDWWVRHHPGEDYLTPIKPLPSPQDPVPGLEDGQTRLVAEMGADGNNNQIYVYRRGQTFHALIVHPGESVGQAMSSPWDSKTDLWALYEELGARLRHEPPWCDPHLARFCLLAPPDFSA